MKLENANGEPKWGPWARVLARTVFLGLDLGQRPNQERDSLAVLRFGQPWQITTVMGPGWVTALQQEMVAPAGEYAVLTIDASLTRPVAPEYWRRGCEAALNLCRHVNICWQGQSFQKVQDFIQQLPLQGPAARILLETHPQSNYPERIRDNPTECDLFLRRAFSLLTESEITESFPAASQTHTQHAVAAALVSVAYSRFRSSNIAQDYLSTVIDHDGCFWLLDATSLDTSAKGPSEGPAGAEAPIVPDAP